MPAYARAVAVRVAVASLTIARLFPDLFSYADGQLNLEAQKNQVY